MADKVEWKKAEGFDDPTPKRTRAKKTPSPLPVGRPGSSGKPSLKAPIGGLLVMLNLPVQMFFPPDALDNAEIEALATALDEQCKISPRFRKYVESMLGMATGGQLLSVTGMIAARRLARHGFLGDSGENVDRVLGDQLASMTGEQAMMPPYEHKEPEYGGPGNAGIPVAGAPTNSTGT